jgi:hypothetical protein
MSISGLTGSVANISFEPPKKSTRVPMSTTDEWQRAPDIFIGGE